MNFRVLDLLVKNTTPLSEGGGGGDISALQQDFVLHPRELAIYNSGRIQLHVGFTPVQFCTKMVEFSLTLLLES